jgi:RHS repeat-associated protein
MIALLAFVACGGRDTRNTASLEAAGATRSADTADRAPNVLSVRPQDIAVPTNTIVSDGVSTRPPLGDASLNVSEFGDAQDHIPIWVPPGRNGIQPELSLDYSSNTENGLYGMGWSLSGLPRITRCRTRGGPPVSWGNPVQNVFCLNGELLAPTTADFTTFRPLRDDFSLITAHGETPLGPSSFEQRTKDGRIFTFGGAGATASGVPMGQYAPGLFAWAVSRIEDRAGNFLTVKYVTGGSTDILPSEIDYTGSASDPSTKRSVKFLYENRPDVDDFYVSGMEFKRSQRLSRLEMYAPTSVGQALVRSIDLHYTQSPTTGRSLLHEVVECAVDAAANAAGSPTATSCRNSFLVYTVGDLGFDDIDTQIPNLQTAQIAVLDIDGDGRQDILYPANDVTYHFRLSNGAGFGADQATGIPASFTFDAANPLYWPHPADIDGDGHTDVLVATGTPHVPGFTAYRATPSSATPGGWTFSAMPWSAKNGFWYDVADLDGDHYPDLLKTDTSGNVWALLNAGGTLPDDNAAQFLATRPVSNDPFWTRLFADLNGDGHTELLMPSWPAPPTDPANPTTGPYMATELGAPGPSPSATALPAIRVGATTQQLHPYFADVNGDGLADAIYGFNFSYLDPRSGSLFINTGRGFLGAATQSAINPLAIGTAPVRQIDWNLDGKADILQQIVYAGDPHAGGILEPAFSILSYAGGGALAQTNLAPQVDMKDGFPASALQVLDVNGDGLDDFVSFMKGSLHVFRHRGGKPDLLKEAFGALGPTVDITYKPAASPDSSADCKVPIHCVTGQLWVVDSVAVDNGVGGANTYQHTYRGGRVDLARWGLLGFKTHVIQDLQTGATTTRTFDLGAWSDGPVTLYPFAGRPTAEVTTAVDPQTSITRTTTKNRSYYVRSVGPFGPFAVLPATLDELTTDTLPGGAVAPVAQHSAQVPSMFDYDDYGNILNKGDLWPMDGVSQSTQVTYQNRPDAWLVSLPRRKTVSQSAGYEDATRETGYEFDDKGQLFRRTDNPGNDNGTSFDPLPPQADGVQTFYTEFDRNPNGLIVRRVVSDALTAGSSRIATAQYDSSEGMFPALSVDAIGHAVNMAYEASLGVPAALVDENTLSTTYQYDAWGRPRAEHPPTGDDRTITYLPGSSAMPFGGTEYKRAGGADIVTVLDPVGREQSTATTGRADGQTVYVSTSYDAQGRVHQKSRPYFQGAATSATTFDYDVVGRVVRVTHPDGSQESTGYAGATRTIVDPAGNRKVITYDGRARPVSTVETVAAQPPHVTTTTLAYGPFDTLETVTDTAGNVVRTIYDRLGRPRIKLDPDAGGARKYVYDAFGEPTHDMRGGTWDGTTFSGGNDRMSTYDAIGRLTQQTGAGPSRALAWDTAANGIGRLAAAVMGDTTLKFTYDSASRLATKAWTIGSAGVSIGYGYDATNRLATTTYPAIFGSTGQLLRTPPVVRNHYSNGGQLTSVTDGGGGVVYWTLESSDASDTFSTEKLGDGVETKRSEDAQHPGWLSTIVSTNGSATVQSLTYHWDGHGRLRGRDDAVDGTTETFDYDGVDRLIHWSWIQGSNARAVGYHYDDLGDLVSKVVESGAGASVSYAYDPVHFGPHQACAVDATSCPATGGAFTYDAHGNQIAAPGRTVAFTAFDLPATLSTGAGRYTFDYDGLLHRVSRQAPDGSTILSLDGYERRTSASGTHHIFTISAHHPVAQIESIVAPLGFLVGETTTYLLTDHQGTIDTLIDGSARVTHAKYEPFGARVQVSDPSRPGAAMPDGVRTGFTGQEHDDDLGLIDMGGRVYDPVQQRFLSEDPIAPNPTKGQALSPYAYVFNNPLNWTDPTGLEGEGGDDGEGDLGGEGAGGTGGGDGTTDGPGSGAGNSLGAQNDPVSSQNQNATQGFDAQSGPSSAETTGLGAFQFPESLPGDSAPEYEWQGASFSLGGCAANAGCRAYYLEDSGQSEMPHEPEHAFWSGDQNKWSSFYYARQNGWTTLEMTNQGLLGTYFNLVFSKENNPILTVYWYHATIAFAASSKGTAHAFVDATGAMPPSLFGWATSFWMNIELPILLNNPDVDRIQYHMVDGYPLGSLVRTDQGGWRQEGPLSSSEWLYDRAKEAWDRLWDRYRAQ